MNENYVKPITYDELYERIKKNIKKDRELEVINKSYEFATAKHQGKKRKNGDDYISHPLEVANILCDLNVDYVTIVGAILHETVNHSDTTIEEIKEEFGSEIASIILSISKINRLELKSDEDHSVKYFREVLVGLSEDVRVLFIKLADRLHNMRTIYALEEDEQKKKANETISVLIPIARHLGINNINSELEDLCLKYTKKEIYDDILEKLNNSREELNELLLKMQQSLSDLLTENGIAFKIKGRVKSVHSLYNKMSSGKRFEDIYDVLALRIFVEHDTDCYVVIGLIHSRFRPLPKRFKDYIANPKQNMYQSLHTTVFGPDGHPFEVQVRTYEMDEVAEKGIAAHWSYKEKGSSKVQSLMEQKLEMFRNTIDANKEITNDTEFINNLNDEVLTKAIYCYTPKGDVIELPIGSTPIDFAYRIHSKVGDNTIGAIVNDQIVTLDYTLEDGDIINIKTTKDGAPKKDWLKFVKTSQAKSKIKSYFSKQDRLNYIENGKANIEREIKKRKLALSEVLTEQNITKICKDLHLNDLEDIYLSVGSLRYTASYIISLIYEDKKDVLDVYLDKINTTPTYKNKTLKDDIIVSGKDNILVSIAKCCKPIRGDKIIGYITKGDGIEVHKENCPNIKESKRLIDVAWNESSTNAFITDIKIRVLKDKNQLLEIVAKASQKDIYIEAVKTTEDADCFNYILSIKTENKEKLENFISDVKSSPKVLEISRK